MSRSTAIVLGVLALGFIVQATSLIRQHRQTPGVIDAARARRGRRVVVVVAIALLLGLALINIVRHSGAPHP